MIVDRDADAIRRQVLDTIHAVAPETDVAKQERVDSRGRTLVLSTTQESHADPKIAGIDASVRLPRHAPPGGD